MTMPTQLTTFPAARLIALAAAALLAGCALGPEYAGPPDAAPRAAQSGRFVRADASATAAMPSNRWWEGLDDPLLNSLVQRALEANPNLSVARARLQQSRAALNLEQANAAPTVGASALAAHARLPPVNLAGLNGGSGSSSSGSSTSANLYSLGFDATWEVDLFGAHRRAVQSAGASAEAAEASLADVQVSLAAEVANAYINLRDRQQRLALGEQSVRAQEDMLRLTGQRVERGTASALDQIRIQNQLDGTRADLVPLQADRDAYLNQLATLLGREPGALDGELAAVAPVPLPPAQVAVGDPTSLLRRRPDVRAAERTLAADTAKIGQAEAARYPSLKLFGVIGLGGTHASDLTRLDDFAAIGAPMLSWNFLDFGRAKARVTQAERVRDEAEAKYRQAVLEALRDAEDSLSRFRYGRVTVATVARTKASADRALELASQRYKAGTGTLIEVLDTTRQQLSAQQNLLQAEANLTRSFVGIQKALGLGWSPEG
ncbi:MAG: Toluene efflux pump outer membrane protein TtgC [Herbaspirillum frisingense]|uniref:Toluene efflux pump outer membrane protein TtgC n=1 Tax=Herbaspirillum frisingense TaxID=92645 RepID=A0A7V8FX52_9BURK|nr:MAG: Toluene efflux pump outer membrane protein TtgC [Herbaspirillum frisingense]